ncbi:MAG: DUF1844 domain-containing protein [Deltaproteobacteria bacterium]|jgi:hypothetical protein|nr:DUF1844 domain-containing protein [Deltaproteobacteria bacterium]
MSNTDAHKDEGKLMPGVNFSTFIVSIGTSALMYLGELSAPGAEGPKKDLAMAKHTIDTLAMLQTKTAGNLTNDETELLRQLLYDLRMKYITATSA